MPKLIPTQTAEALIAAVQKKECLYDTTNPGYRNRHITELAWKDVADELERDVVACKAMWASLRCTFNRNLTISKRLSSGSSAVKQPKWNFFKQMLFLKQHVSRGLVSSSNMTDDASISQDTDSEHTFMIDFDSSQQELQLETEDIAASTESEPGPSGPTATATTTFDDSDASADTSGSSSASKGKGKGKKKKRKVPESDPVQKAVIDFIDNKQRPRVEEKHLGFFQALLPYFEMLTPVQQLHYMQQITGILMEMVAANTPNCSELK